MTTIVYRDGILAGDTGVCRGEFTLPERQRKVFRLRDGRLFGWSGRLDHMVAVRTALDEQTDVPECEGSFGILIEPDGSIFTIEQGAVAPVFGPYVALGSGKEFAYGALAMSADAREAVRVAAQFDRGNTKLPLHWLKLRK